MDRSHLRLLVVGAVVAVTVAVTVVVARGQRTRDIVLNVEPIDEASEITVYAGGAVAKPGLYTLPAHARVATLLDEAGLLASADNGALQMAAELHDGQQVIVPTREATVTVPTTASVEATYTADATPTAVMAGPINVNSATKAELEALPGIGPALAQRIIDYRNANGPFASLDELANVRGISARMVDELRSLATVGS